MTKYNDLATIKKIKTYIASISSEKQDDNTRLLLYRVLATAEDLIQKLSELEDAEIAIDQNLLEQKHKFISLLLLNPDTFQFASIAIQNILADQIHPDFLVCGYDKHNPYASKSKVDLLSYILFLRKNLSHQTTKEFNDHINNVAKLLIESGDVMVAANFAIRSNQNFNMFHCEYEPENYYMFHNMLQNFYPTVYRQVREYLSNLGLERSFTGRKFTCTISNKFPTIPVRLNGKLYDLIALAEKLQIVEGRTNPYQFSFNDREIDISAITIDRQYFSRLHHWVNDILPSTMPIETAYALTAYNFSPLFWSMLPSVAITIFARLIFSKGFPAYADKREKVDFLLIFCIHNVAKALFIGTDSQALISGEIKHHSNAYIRNLIKFNNFYAWLLMASAVFIPLLTVYSIKIKKHPDDPIYNYLPTDYVPEHFNSLCFGPYWIVYATYMFNFIMQSKATTFRQINSEPTIALDTQQKPPESRRQILFNFQQIIGASSTRSNPSSIDTVEQGFGYQKRETLGL